MIEIEKLTFDHPGHRALDAVSLRVPEGSVTALVGPNGAGKTTLIRCIAGLETPLEGRITVDGTDVIEQPREVHRIMGYLSDFYGLYQELSVARCLEYAAAAQGLPEADISAAVARTAAQLDLADKLAQPAGNLSRGQRQRVAIGQAIIHRPKLLLLDEPASGLDPEARASLAILFRQLQAEGMTLLVSSHILAELDEYSTHMLALRDGRILENRQLHPVHTAQATRRLRLELSSPDQRLPGWMQQQAGVLPRQSDAQQAEFDFNGDAHAQAALLKALIAQGFPVCSLASHKENLQQSYLRTVAAHLEGTR
ncbi:MAG: ABC transporter ATP-binding protein [Gallionella sp.]|nr:ABC transporter ATP-binding protein [Gallionella sp.]MDD4946410.1 ABC transporter ATP-binding protein [Gallionella sp.]MDD5611694.1 ABC transporter ATP-binding protein [Gallionella sp.]